MNDITEVVKDIIVEQLGVNRESVKGNVSIIDDLDADSLDVVELIMAFEEKFNCEISEKQAEQLTTVDEVSNCIQQIKMNNATVSG